MNVVLVDLRKHLDCASWHIPDDVGLFALLGGHCPSGSLKDVALLHVIHTAVTRGELAPGRPVAEISNGSMARSVVWAAGRIGSPVYLSFPGVSQSLVEEIVGAGKATALQVAPSRDFSHPMLGFFAAFEACCKERNYFYPDQTRNKAFAETILVWRHSNTGPTSDQGKFRRFCHAGPLHFPTCGRELPLFTVPNSDASVS